MSDQILICISCHNRKRVAELCLPTMRDSVRPQDVLLLCNDGSAEYDCAWLYEFLPHSNSESWILGEETPIGIQAQRRAHLAMFMKLPSFTHLYLTDHDVIHDPSWADRGLALQAATGNAPLCLYNTRAHSELTRNTIEDDPRSDVIWRRVAPGVSYLLTRKHVERIAHQIDTLQHFDWEIPALLGSRFAVSRVCYCDHIGWGGQRHPESEGPEGGDRSTSPTDWLKAKRSEIVAKLNVDSR